MRRFFILLFLLHPLFFVGQTPVANDSISLSKDTAMFMDLLVKGKLDVHIRSMYMHTINEGALKDDYALASGAGLGLTTKPYHGFQAGISSFVIYKLLSSDLASPDQRTMAPNRYEIGLFDIQQTDSKKALIRLEHFFLNYSFSKTLVAIGKMKLNTPFLNPQDGRMNITMGEGVWVSCSELKKIQLNGGWFWNISPRSTTRWYSVSRSIGLYPMGVTAQGSRSNYFEKIQSNGVAIGNVLVDLNKAIKVNLFDMLIDQVLNTSLFELNAAFGKRLEIYEGIMYVHQDAIGNGGNADQSMTYASRGSHSNAISFQTGIKNKKVNVNLNYTHITGDGRYLSPREWGKDPFYTFLPREKNEGFGNVYAITARATFSFLKEKMKTGVAYGYYQLPDVKNYRLNKYGMPSYHQVNVDASYRVPGFFTGLEIKFLAAFKLDKGETYDDPKYKYNKVNMVNINLILDFKI
jgi:hypothetical protein